MLFVKERPYFVVQGVADNGTAKHSPAQQCLTQSVSLHSLAVVREVTTLLCFVVGTGEGLGGARAEPERPMHAGEQGASRRIGDMSSTSATCRLPPRYLSLYKMRDSFVF